LLQFAPCNDLPIRVQEGVYVDGLKRANLLVREWPQMKSQIRTGRIVGDGLLPVFGAMEHSRGKISRQSRFERAIWQPKARQALCS